MSKRTPTEALRAAELNEDQASCALVAAALAYAGAVRSQMDLAAPYDTLTTWAKKWTNAYHQASRCRKHLREAEARSQIRRAE